MKQLRQRLSVSCHLGPLTKDETREYFYHRLKCAGNRHAIKFSEQNFNQIHRLCKGVPRLINIFGDYLLLAAYNDEMTALSTRYVKDIISEIEETVAFSESDTRLDVAASNSRNARDSDMANIDSHLAGLLEDLDNEALLRNIIRKQIIQMDRLQDQLEAIAASLHIFEQALQNLSREQVSGDSKQGVLKQVLPG